jgi:hypothetical protein
MGKGAAMGALVVVYAGSGQPDPLHDPVHFQLGDSASTMRAACGDSLRDQCWTQNPHEVTCARCKSSLQELPG